MSIVFDRSGSAKANTFLECSVKVKITYSWRFDDDMIWSLSLQENNNRLLKVSCQYIKLTCGSLRCPRICPFWSILTLVRESMREWYKRRVVLERLLWDGCGGHSEPKTAKKRVFLPYWRQKIGFKFFPSYIWCKMGLFYDPWSLKKIGPKESPKMA